MVIFFFFLFLFLKWLLSQPLCRALLFTLEATNLGLPRQAGTGLEGQPRPRSAAVLPATSVVFLAVDVHVFQANDNPLGRARPASATALCATEEGRKAHEEKGLVFIGTVTIANLYIRGRGRRGDGTLEWVEPVCKNKRKKKKESHTQQNETKLNGNSKAGMPFGTA